ncbi:MULTISPECIES: ammonium transporter [Stutzerimonas stutzeri subgroup]|jgi:Amt family ammonium transporter|uniref:Ammonium transporter n=5 Tax=Stutzerimonas stutzeri subgroup TaxID=578833 RepID=A0A0D7E2E6_STUST|nr:MULTISPECIES: ammonium transporter [Stutzerimonas stutzeri group]KJS25925.1 MAG: ammonium transporter [Pseudomonas sp. BRH_c35]MAK88412.1 ammonium transporter [Pseudomonas sp.]MBU0918480.1 ammonium transporter [Gammaproteobacteria bacterium]MCB4796221.1 ammonium transporter [Pseudomonas sp. NP21570]OCX92169.1 MAG: ammonium transporter [Pseudomonas sp. K35]OHC13441.1 MAG: ammonium transporter [Pseudomonadales bacterium GWC2_63_15]RRU72034.1 ammonium transporter [Stutzerimonas xanthomarina]|tara:strand:+ start:2424 stop:3674 length:1251 start_codon:yes stop_codon:yes gene_type:complete
MDSTALIPVQYGLDTFYFVICGALVMWMAAGFAMLEAGLVRAKNTAEILTKNIVLYALASIMYLLVGYYIMYSSPDGGILPSLGFLIGDENAVDVVAAGGEDAPYYSARADFFFQIVFAATCMSVVSGAVAERMKLWAFIAFAVVMTGFIYPVQGFWKWGGGFLDAAGFLDFAGSGIVHMAGAAAALAGVLLLGPRKGKYGANGQINAIPGANMPLATLGAFILWMGWFGFNGGSQLKMSTIEDANAVAQVFVNTNMGAAGGLIAALITARLLFGKSDLTMVLNGALAGLVAITAEPLTPSALQATLIGGVGGVLVVFSILGLDKLKLDDPVGAISVHGVAGMWGLLAVPLTNADATFGAQLLGLVSIFLWVFIASLIVWGIIKAVMGLRVSEEEEYEGVDVVECGLEAYPEFTRQ